MKLLDRLKARFVRRPDFHVAPAQATQAPPEPEPGWVPRNRAERRMLMRYAKMDGRRRMRLEGRRKHNHRLSKRVRDQQRHIKTMIRMLDKP